MRIQRHLSLYLATFILATCGHAVFGQDSNRAETHSSSEMAGSWSVEKKRTNEANADARKRMSPEMIEVLNSMELHLGNDGSFKQTMGPTHEVVGQWTFELSSSTNESDPTRGLLTLVPENLGNHANMEFEIEFTTPDVVEANPRQGQGVVFLKREQADDESSPRDADSDQEQDKDRAAELFANVPGCLGARSFEQNGVQISFVWFENRDAVVDWCESQKHMSTAETVLKIADPDLEMREPMEASPDEQGPFLVIVTVKPKTERGAGFPLEQLSMEIYKPVDGGMFVGDRFAPQEFKVKGLREIVPKNE